MKTHLALLRGINVSGNKMIKMDQLKRALEAIGFQHVETYIQSGNVFVSSNEESSKKVGLLISKEIYKSFGHDVPIVVIGKQNLQDCFQNNPFFKEPGADLKKLYVAFLSTELPEGIENQLNFNIIKPDELHIDSNRMYIKYAVSPAKTRLDQNWIEKKLNVTATIRNWNTITNLLSIFETRTD